LARDGFDIILHCRIRREDAQRVAEEIAAPEREVRILQFDVTNREWTRDAITQDIEQHDAYYGVVCNAGIVRDNVFPGMSGEEWDAVIRTNLDGFYNVLSPIVLPMVRRRGPGRIVTIASISGLMGNRGQVNYSAAKAGIIGASKALAIELAKRGITVNCVAPGLIETEMIEGLPLDEVIKQIPVQRLGKPEDVAAVVSFLMSDDAAYVTRQVISVNGGLI
jgi:3-oxoacyl-[acyl-carrier protein] reductase